MAVNKNFVVKNGLEVATDVILADATSKNVGIGSTIPANTLDVRGGIGATDLNVTGITTVINEFNVGTGGTVLTVNQSPGRVGVGSTQPEYLLDVRSEVSTGTTALYVQGDVRITGDLNVDDITLTDISGSSLNISGLSTLGGYVDINSSVDVAGSLNVVGVTTLGTATNIPDVTVSGVATVATLYAAAGIFTGTSVNVSTATTTKDLLVTGIATIADARIAAGILTASSLDIAGLTTTKDLLVTGVTTSTDIEIYTQFDITNNGSSAYQFAATGIGFTQATDNPTLYLTRGKNYHFSVNASGHPFYIKTVNSTGTGNAYDDGVTNNGAAVGVVTFKVPYNAPDILHYNCSIHSGMHGEIRVGATGGGVGVGSEGTFIGAGATMIDFKTSTGTNVQSVDLNAGIATVTIQPGVSLGLAIALGG
jgi:hypothetical protein